MYLNLTLYFYNNIENLNKSALKSVIPMIIAFFLKKLATGGNMLATGSNA